MQSDVEVVFESQWLSDVHPVLAMVSPGQVESGASEAFQAPSTPKRGEV